MHVLRKDENDWMKKCMDYEVERVRPSVWCAIAPCAVCSHHIPGMVTCNWCTQLHWSVHWYTWDFMCSSSLQCSYSAVGLSLRLSSKMSALCLNGQSTSKTGFIC